MFINHEAEGDADSDDEGLADVDELGLDEGDALPDELGEADDEPLALDDGDAELDGDADNELLVDSDADGERLADGLELVSGSSALGRILRETSSS